MIPHPHLFEVPNDDNHFPAWHAPGWTETWSLSGNKLAKSLTVLIAGLTYDNVFGENMYIYI